MFFWNNHQAPFILSLQFLFFCCGWLYLIPVASAQAPAWFETNAWTGSGTARTEIFWANTERWRIRYRPRGSGTFHVGVYNPKGELVEVAVDQSEPLRGMKTLNLRGEFFLAITGSGMAWEVTVEQHLNLVEEWQLLQRRRQPAPEMWKIAVWTGGAGKHEYELDVPHGSWQVVHENKGEGLLQIKVFDHKNELAVAANNDTSGTGSSWLHRPGKARVQINALDTEWRIEVFCEAPREGQEP